MSSSQASASVPFSSYTPRVAIVTGAAQGIGRAIAHRLAEDGIDVAVNDIPPKLKELEEVVEEVRKKGRRAIAFAGDVSSEKDVAALVEKTASELGSVDIVSPLIRLPTPILTSLQMVANAGIIPLSPFTDSKSNFCLKLDSDLLSVRFSDSRILRSHV